MNPPDGIAALLDGAMRRMSRYVLARGLAVAAASALLLTLVTAWSLRGIGISPTAVSWGRVLLLVSVGAALMLGIAVPL